MEQETAVSTQARNRLKRWWWGPFVLGIGLCLLWVRADETLTPTAVQEIGRPLVDVDISQKRLNAAPPIPQGSFALNQSFYPRWDGFREIELILVRYDEPQPDEDGRLWFHLYDEKENLIVEEAIATNTISHNQTHLLRFPPQSAAGRRYTLQISGNEENPVSVWGYDLDVYSQGELTLTFGPLSTTPIQTEVKDLYFITRYQLTWPDAFIALGTRLARDGLLLLLALFFMPLPGCLLLLFASKPRRWDGWAWWGTALALGLAVWPVVWFWLTLVNGRVWGWLLWGLVIGGWGLVLYRWRQRPPSSTARQGARRWGHHLLLLLLLLVGLAGRLLAVRSLNIPPWVDASRHALITAVMSDSGQAPTDYGDYLPVSRFPYHFGFHTVAASLQMMSDWPLNRLLLVLGQLLNGLIPLMVYTAVWIMTRQRGASFLAAFLVALPFFFPAYYATWGRFTQLTGMLIMPVLLALTWQLMQGGPTGRQHWWGVGLLTAGLFFIHFRVFLIYLPFVVVVWVVSRGRHTRWLMLSALLSLVLTGPRLVQLIAMTEPVEATGATIANYNTFPISYLQAGWEQHFLWLAGLGLIMALLAQLYRRSWAVLPLVLVAWVALLINLLAGEKLGLPETNLINLNSVYITLFVPLAIFLSLVAAQLWRWLQRTHWLLQTAAYLVVGAAFTLIALFGIRQQIAILNPQTVLAEPEDLKGLLWAEAHLPETAVVAVSSWRWLGSTWAGNDGGAWLVPLTGRSSTTPPADYIYDAALDASVNQFNETATTIEDWDEVENARWLQAQGVTHIFVGKDGGFFDPATLAHNPALTMMYDEDGVFIFALK